MKGIILILAAAISGCVATTPAATAPGPATTVRAAGAQAVASLLDARGRPAGTAKFVENGDRVTLELNVVGLDPGRHGFHIHETGRCEPPEFKSAGGHFNPAGKEHGTQNPKGAHAGDLPNLVASEDGMASAEMALPGVTLAPGAKHSLLDADGSALVIHAREDDQKSDPAGNAGGRVACGVVTAH